MNLIPCGRPPRVGLELAAPDLTSAQKAGLTQDIADLDRLIGDILLASRLDALPEGNADEAIDLLALVAEEWAAIPIRRSMDTRPYS